jgi:hypothetical protein
MGGILKQSTAAHILFGPFVDKTNGVDLEVGAGIITSIDHATTGIFLSKEGGAGAIRHQGVTASVLDAYGMFQVHLDTTDTNTVGRLRVMMAEAATFLPVYDDFMVLPANVYDSLMGTDTLDVQVTGIGADVVTAAAIANGAIDAATFAAGAIDAAAIAAGAIDNATFAADVGSTAYATNIIALAADKAIVNAALGTAAELAKVPKSDSNVTFNATALASINAELDGALNTAIPGSPTANSINERVATMDGLLLGTVAAGTHVAQSGDSFARIGAPAGASIAADLVVIDNFVDGLETTIGAAGAGLTDLATAANLAAVKVDTAAILADTGTDGVLLAAAAVDAVHDEVVEGTTTFRQSLRLMMSALFGKVSGAPTTTLTFRDIGDTKARITATVDADGNRSAVTKDAT